MIYLDNAATTKVDPKVLKAMLPYFEEEYGNAGSVHSCGRSARDAIAKARQQVAGFLNAEPEQIIFTSGGSEGNNMVLSKAMRDELQRRGKNRVVISSVEHDSVYVSARHMCDVQGKTDIKSAFHIDTVGVYKNGVVIVKELEKLFKEKSDIGLVSIMYVNNETGAMNPVKEIAELCHENGALFHTDCVQAAGCEVIDVKDIGCDFATISGHKMYAPKGIGVLFVNNKNDLQPLIRGGAYQEFGYRGGTENTPGIVGIGEACDLLSNKKILRLSNVYYPLLKSVFYDKLIRELEEDGLKDIVHMNGNRDKGKTLSIRVDGIDSETLVLFLDAKGLCVSSGSACHGHESEPSRVLLAMGLTEEQADATIRISFSKYNSVDDASSAAKIMSSCIKTLLSLK